MIAKEPKDVVILVVDDEDDLRTAIVRDFTRRGYQVLGARNGTEAFAIVQAQPIDLVLSDVRMPGGDGIQLLKDIKELSPTTPVLMFITGFADMSLEEAYDWGADAVFDKPFDRAALFKAVANAVMPANERWKRRAPRIDVAFSVALVLPGFPAAIETKSINIGRGGMFVAMSAPFPSAATPVSFVIRFERGVPSNLSGSGIVRWVHTLPATGLQTGCGIEFVDLDEGSREQVIKLLDATRPRAFIPKR